MSNKPYKEFEPKWVKEPAPADSYRSIFRWGDPNFVKYPKESLYKMMKEKFAMTDEDFAGYAGDIGMEKVELNAPCHLAKEHLEAFVRIAGAENVTTEDYPRLAVAYGKTGYDAARLRERRIDCLPDVVIYPSETEEVEKIVAYCSEKCHPGRCAGKGRRFARYEEEFQQGYFFQRD